MEGRRCCRRRKCHREASIRVSYERMDQVMMDAAYSAPAVREVVHDCGGETAIGSRGGVALAELRMVAVKLLSLLLG